MGYTKIVQFGDTTEIYEYEKDLKKQTGIDHRKAHRLLNGRSDTKSLPTLSVSKKRTKALYEDAKRKGIYKRSARSVKRSVDNFFRLVHHNNCNASTIHFVTLTFAYDITYKLATREVSEFFSRLREVESPVSISYISVPERTKKGRFHFHLLIYGLPPETASIERKTRNIQRLFRRGYVDVMLAHYTSKGLAGYMAKYMAKSFEDQEYECLRGYNCSRNIKKIRSAGSHSFSLAHDLIIPNEFVVDEENREYNVPYLGTCRYKKIITQI